MSMRVCGVDIKGSEAILTIVETSDSGDLAHVQCPTKKVKLHDERSSQQLRAFLDQMTVFARDHEIERFCIKSRKSSGNMASGGITFKIEGLIQLQEVCDCEFISPQAITKLSKSNQGGIPSSVNAYQQDAYLAAAKYLLKVGEN